MQPTSRKCPWNFSYASGGDVSITFNTKKRIRRLGFIENEVFHPSAIGAIAEEELARWSDRFPWLQIIEHTLMPDHVHIFVSWRPGPEVSRNDASVVTAVAWLKSGITRRARAKGLLDANEDLWQRSYWSRIVMDPEDRRRQIRYIRDNPRKWEQKQRARRRRRRAGGR